MYGNADPAVDIPKLLEHHTAGRLDLGALVTRTITLSEVDSAFAQMESGAGARTLIVP
jgi:S-(hydroxymethyl)glutathione dehydrogenase/alcohol dehydrogenase